MPNLIQNVFLGGLILLSSAGAARAQRYERLHSKAVVVDTHNDIISTCIEDSIAFDADLRGRTYSDLRRLKEGGVDVQVFSIWCDGEQPHPYAWANREIDSLYAWEERHPSEIAIVKSPGDLVAAVRKHKLAAMVGVEGGHMIENDIAKLDSLYRRGARYMTLTWNNSVSWATSAMDETHDSLLHQPKGLNDFGRELVRHMNTIGMMVDLSHVGEQTFWDAIHTTTKPVIVSHSCAYALCPVFRNLKDDQIRAVGKNGGVIDVNFYSGFLDSNFENRNAAFLERHHAELDSLHKSGKTGYFSVAYLFSKYPGESRPLRPPLTMLIDQIDYIVRLAGIDHVGLGSDFDGISSSPEQLDEVSDLPIITRELLKRGYSKKDIRKILGGNFIRVFRANQPK